MSAAIPSPTPFGPPMGARVPSLKATSGSSVGLPFGVEGPVEGDLLPAGLGHLHLGAGDQGRGHVQVVGEALAGRRGPGDGVQPHPPVEPAPGGDHRPPGGGGEADAARVGGLLGVVGHRPAVPVAPDAHRRRAVLLGLADGQVHGLVDGDVADAPVAVQDGRRPPVLHHFRLGLGVDVPGAQPADVDRRPARPVRVDAPQDRRSPGTRP